MLLIPHDIEQIYFDGEEWRIICACSWEAWGRRDEESARDAFDDHVLDEIHTELRALHEARRATA